MGSSSSSSSNCLTSLHSDAMADYCGASDQGMCSLHSPKIMVTANLSTLAKHASNSDLMFGKGLEMGLSFLDVCSAQ